MTTGVSSGAVLKEGFGVCPIRRRVGTVAVKWFLI